MTRGSGGLLDQLGQVGYDMSEVTDMTQVNMLEAKTNLTKLIRLLETRQEDEILIARNGQPVAKIVKFEKQTGRIGSASRKHRSLDLDEFNAMNEEIAKEFYGEL